MITKEFIKTVTDNLQGAGFGTWKTEEHKNYVKMLSKFNNVNFNVIWPLNQNNDDFVIQMNNVQDTILLNEYIEDRVIGAIMEVEI